MPKKSAPKKAPAVPCMLSEEYHLGPFRVEYAEWRSDQFPLGKRQEVLIYVGCHLAHRTTLYGEPPSPLTDGREGTVEQVTHPVPNYVPLDIVKTLRPKTPPPPAPKAKPFKAAAPSILGKAPAKRPGPNPYTKAPLKPVEVGKLKKRS